VKSPFRGGAGGSGAPPKPAPSPAAPRVPVAGSANGLRRGDLIGDRLEVLRLLGEGGFGRVYLARRVGTNSRYAVKVMRTRYLRSPEMIARFQAEANTWVDLGSHPNIVQALRVGVSNGQLHIDLEYVPPNPAGRVSLADYLRYSRPDLDQNLRWAIDCCRGLEYAYSKGIQAHRDIKPTNILIREGRALITDFGLAGALGADMQGKGIGSLAYMPPEQFDDITACDQRSDLYSFGVTMFQMADEERRLPFRVEPPVDDTAESWDEYLHSIYVEHATSPVTPLDSPLRPIVERLLQKSPADRYGSFAELRADLQSLQGESGVVHKVAPREASQETEIGIAGLIDRALSLKALGRYEEALVCTEQAVSLEPDGLLGWMNHAGVLRDMGRREEALADYAYACGVWPDSFELWLGLGVTLQGLARYEDAMDAFGRASELNQKHPYLWYDMGIGYRKLGRGAEAIAAFQQALEIDPRLGEAWIELGNALVDARRYQDAIEALSSGLRLKPTAGAGWVALGNAHVGLGNHRQAGPCFDRAIEVNPNDAIAWLKRGYSLRMLGLREAARTSLERATQIKPDLEIAWLNLAVVLNGLHRYREAVTAVDRALSLNPASSLGWGVKGESLASLTMTRDALECLQRAVEINPAYGAAWALMARLFQTLGDPTSAGASRSRALALQAKSPKGRR
jgi:tetratricopeptide (TPR) repeat protein